MIPTPDARSFRATMTAEIIKTPIPGTTFNVIPSEDFFIRDEGLDAYQIETQPIVVEGVCGEFDVKIEGGFVSVTAFFGSERWGQNIAEPVVVDDVRYSVALRTKLVSLADFDLASSSAQLTFSMQNLDVRMCDLPTSVAATDPVFARTEARFAAATSRYVTELALKNPGFSDGFRQAVASLEIERLRHLQEVAWRDISERTRTIQQYMKFVSEEMNRVTPWNFSSQESESIPIRAVRDTLSVDASGVHSVKVQLADGATFIMTGLIDGTVRTDVIRP